MGEAGYAIRALVFRVFFCEQKKKKEKEKGRKTRTRTSRRSILIPIRGTGKRINLEFLSGVVN